jgi:ribose 5-phosphate isomerase RpiB
VSRVDTRVDVRASHQTTLRALADYDEDSMRSVFTERDIPLGSDLSVPAGSILTPSALDPARDRGVKIIELKTGESLAPASSVASGAAARRVIIDGAGIGSAIVANKFPGVRAALCYDGATARNSSEHNDANGLTLGGCLPSITQGEDVLRMWLSTPFGGGRHAARVDEIKEIDKANLKWTLLNKTR